MKAKDIAEIISQEIASRRILIVEDDESDAILASKALQGFDVTSDWVKSGEAAQQIVSETRYNLALVDIKLPRMNGLQFCQWLRAHYPDVKCVLLTGVVDNLMRDLALDDHFAVMKKPMSDDNVRLVLESIDSRNSTISNTAQTN